MPIKSIKNKLGITLKKTKCCCGATKELPCICMIIGASCSKTTPICPCFKLLKKQNA
jgi:hypothetical protein